MYMNMCSTTCISFYNVHLAPLLHVWHYSRLFPITVYNCTSILFHCSICYHLLLYYPPSHSILFLSQKITVRLCNAWARVAIMCICGIVPVRYEAAYWKGLNINSRVRSGELLTNDRFLPTPPYARPYATLLSRLLLSRLLLSRLLPHCYLD